MNEIEAWIGELGYDGVLQVASEDASFRNYYRLINGADSYIVMDSSLQKESLLPFIDMTDRLAKSGVRVPKIYAQNMREGFLLLEDLGNRHLLQDLSKSNYQEYYAKAIDEIIKMQTADIENLPLYDAGFLRFEMELIQEWYLEKYLDKSLDAEEKQIISDMIDRVVEVVLSQYQGVFVHRDFHSRNIMITPLDEVAVIDYQDARVGAITYDLVSLLRDCYIAFGPREIEKLALTFKDKKGLDVDDATFIRWFDFMGLQRHIKVLGIFARLHLRDGKDGYLDDIPQTLKYVKEVGAKYEEMKPLLQLFEKLGA